MTGSTVTAGTGILAKWTPGDRGLVRIPLLTPHLEFHAIGDDRALLVSESFNTLLHGRLCCDLLPLLDGRHDADGIVSALDGIHGARDIRSTISALAEKGYVVSGEHSMDRQRSAWWSSLGASPRWVEQRLALSGVVVEGDDGQLAAHLAALGVVSGTGGEASLRIVLCDDYLGSDLEDVNRRQLEAHEPWMLARPRGVEALFGPVFRDHGPCWECLASRMRNHQEVHAFLRNVAGEDAAFRPFASEGVVLEGLLRLIAAETVKWLVLGESAPVHDGVIAVDTGDLASSRHRVMRRPQCRACGDDELHSPDRPPVPLILDASPKAFRTSGGAHSVAPDVTLATYRHLVSPISGVVSWLSRTTDEGDPWLHVDWAGSNLGVRSRSLASLRRSLRSKSAGKGSTPVQSRVSALCEAIERHCGARSGDEIRIRKAFNSFDGDAGALHPNDVQLFSDNQLDNAGIINEKGHPYNIVPARFDPDAAVDWTPVWSLTQQRHRYLPTSMLYSMAAEERGPADLIADSNGCAAGNTLEEAILQGFYELVERDAFAIWWYNRLGMPAVDPCTFDDPYLVDAAAVYARYGREMWMLDITSDLGIPTFVALSRRVDADSEDIIYGAGTHADPRLAALRAVCELNQCLTWLPRPEGRDGRPMIDDPMVLSWWRTASLAGCPWLAPAADAAPGRALEPSFAESADTRDDVESCRALIEAKGMEFLVLNQTRPDIGMPVVRVIVPGMRHFWERFAPGRLYEVPVSQGYRDDPPGEADLNTAPVLA